MGTGFRRVTLKEKARRCAACRAFLTRTISISRRLRRGGSNSRSRPNSAAARCGKPALRNRPGAARHRPEPGRSRRRRRGASRAADDGAGGETADDAGRDRAALAARMRGSRQRGGDCRCRRGGYESFVHCGFLQCRDWRAIIGHSPFGPVNGTLAGRRSAAAPADHIAPLVAHRAAGPIAAGATIRRRPRIDRIRLIAGDRIIGARIGVEPAAN